MEFDFTKICRICLSEGVMMSIFKVNISKKLMACASVQVWQNDGLPTQICNRCSAKLHIAFQFKKQCEKSDAKLRLYLSKLKDNEICDRELGQHTTDSHEQLTNNDMTLEKITNDVDNLRPHDNSQSTNNCVYIELPPAEPNYLTAPNQVQVTQFNFNEAHLQIHGYNLHNVGQTYAGTYSMPMQPVSGTIPSAIPHTTDIHPAEVVQSAEEKDKSRSNKKINKISRNSNKIIDSKQCQTCSKVFATVAKLSRHIKTHSSYMPYKCKICSKAFSHSGNYKIHLRMHSDERPFKCAVCNKGCRQLQDLEKHMRTHTGERPHKCHMCPRAFSTSSNLIAHVRIHTGERPYVCCVCQKAFCQSNELTKHMRTHTGEKSHVCDICNKGFNGSSGLTVHRRSHTGERPYACSTCNKSFSQSSILAGHMKRHNNTEKTPINCTQCGTSFVSSVDLLAHLKTHEIVEVLTDNETNI